MRRFTQLYSELDRTTKTNAKLDALVRYFTDTPPADAAWGLLFISGHTLPRAISSTALRDWIAEESGHPPWLVDESYSEVGDLAEAAALLLPDAPESSDAPLHELVESRLLPLRDLPLESRRELLSRTWRELDAEQRLVWNKLMIGSFRVGVSKTLVVRALATVAGVTADVMAHRLMGDWQPTEADYRRLMAPHDQRDDAHGRPYPFYLAYQLDDPPATLGNPSDWQAEWKWDGIRAQLIRRAGHVLIWSRGEELITDRFPEVLTVGRALPDGTVLDGEILPWRDGALPFALLQRRIGRKQVTPRLLETVPVVFMAYDLLEQDGRDLRALPLSERREKLERLVTGLRDDQPALAITVSPVVPFADWDEAIALQARATEHAAEGFMLKRRDAPYGVGRKRGAWWKWKVDPHHIDAVLIYAQRGSGRRASLYTDYTFGVWHQGELIPVAKAYSGLTDAEIHEVDRFVRGNTIERFGPVRVVRPELVFELAFERVQESTRHKSGVAVRFPRMARWRKDKPASEADTLENVKALIRQVPAVEPEARAARAASRTDRVAKDLYSDLSDP